MKTKLAQFAFVIVLIGAMAAAFVMGKADRDNTSAFASAASARLLNDAQRAAVIKLQAEGVVRVEERRGKVWVAPQEWRSVDAAGKEQFALLLAGYIWDKDWPADIEIYDMQSAKRLARYGRLGLTVD